MSEQLRPPGGTPHGEPRRSKTRRALAAGIRGLQAGLVATLIMTAFRLPIMRSLPPTADLVARYAGGEPDDHPLSGLGLHLLYGTIAGSAFGAGYALLDENRSIEPEQRGIVWGTVYGLGLSVFGAQVVLPRLVDARPDADELSLFHASHLVYGLSLGAWVGSRTEGVEDPDREYDYESDEDQPLRTVLSSEG